MRITISIDIADNEANHLRAIKFIEAALETQLGKDDMAQTRVLQYCEQRVHDRVMSQNSMPIGQLMPPDMFKVQS